MVQECAAGKRLVRATDNLRPPPEFTHYILPASRLCQDGFLSRQEFQPPSFSPQLLNNKK